MGASQARAPIFLIDLASYVFKAGAKLFIISHCGHSCQNLGCTRGHFRSAARLCFDHCWSHVAWRFISEQLLGFLLSLASCCDYCLLTLFCCRRRLGVILLLAGSLSPSCSDQLSMSIYYVLSFSRIACRSFVLLSTIFSAHLAVPLVAFLTVLARNTCCIMRQSISWRLSLMIGTKTVHCGSLIDTSCQFGCVGGKCPDALCGPAFYWAYVLLWLFSRHLPSSSMLC